MNERNPTERPSTANIKLWVVCLCVNNNNVEETIENTIARVEL